MSQPPRSPIAHDISCGPGNNRTTTWRQRLWDHALRGVAAAGLGLAIAGPAAAVSPDVVISQVYGGGRNSGATYKNDFIELHNSGASAVSLNGWSVQYASATGTAWQVTNLGNVTLQPGQYYLVQEAAGTGGTTNLPTPDAAGSIAMSATAGKVALVTSTTPLGCGSTCAGAAGVRDYIGFGTAANYEGSAAAPAPSNTNADLRANEGCTDTDNNIADFTAAVPNPRNTTSTLNVCAAPVINGACGSSNGLSFTSAPTTNLCATGTASAVSGSGPWNWTCAGSNGGSNASCSANLSTGGPFTIFHMNDVHARITPHEWIIPAHGSNPASFEKVGGAAYVAGKMLSLVMAKPTALVLDGGDISEGNPLGDMNGTSTGSYGNGGLTTFYAMLANKLKLIPGRGGRGVDAMVVGNHDVRDASYIANMEQMHIDSGIPVISANVRDIATHTPHFPATTTVTVNGTKVGIIGYTTPTAEVGATLTGTLEVVQCGWNTTPAGAANAVNPCHIADYVNDLRNNQHCDVVILLTHDGHGDLVDPTTPVLADTVDAKLPEIAVTGHWHTWAETVWQPESLNYKTIFTESASYMKYIGELNVDATGTFLSSEQHVLRNADITPDPDVAAFVNGLKATYQASAGHAVDEVVGYTVDPLLLDDYMKWWSADEYPWSGNNTAGQWITDAMKWKCDQIWASSGGCDLAVEAGGGVRADIPAGPVTYLNVYETFPWADDTYVRISMTGQDILNFLKATNLDAGFSSALDVTAVDGIPTSVKMNGSPIGLSTVYKVAINNYMLAHPPGGYTWPAGASPEADPGNELVRESLAEFMRTVHATPATAYHVGGDRYHFNGSYSGAYRAVVTMMNDNESKPSFDNAFIRFLSANPETLARRGSPQVPANLVNADGSINAANRLSEQELYRSFLGFKTGALHPGDIIEVWGKASFYGGNPEFVDQEGVYTGADCPVGFATCEFKIVGHDASLAKPTHLSSISALLNDNYKNHYVQFLATKSAIANTVTDQNGQSLKIWDVTGYAAKTLPGNVGDTLLVSGVLTMENFGFRLRSDNAIVTTAALPAATEVSSHIEPVLPEVSAPITLSATAVISGGGYDLAPVADAQVASGNPATNYGASTNIYVQSSSTSSYGDERVWLKFDLSGIPAGSTITSATLQLWNWKSTGASLPVEVRSSNDDSWTETGLNWSNQPALGGILATQTLASGTINVAYNWDVTTFVQSQFGGDQTVSLLAKPVVEGSADATAPSYGFDAKEYGSNGPVLHVATQASASSVANVRFFYRYSADNSVWGAWTQTATDTTAPYNTNFNFPNGTGYYEFYSVATDNLGGVESTPAFAQAAVHYQAASGAAQSINFAQPADVPVGSAFSVSATASSGLAVSFSSQTAGICTVSGDLVTTVAPGTCTIAANQAGDAGYWLAATLTRSFTVQALAQSISFPGIASQVLGNGPVAMNATASSGLSVQYTSQTLAVCTVSGSSVTLVAAGTCTIAANQAGGGNYAAAPTVTQSFSVTAVTGSEDGDVPLPEWATAMFALVLLETIRRRRMGKRS